MKIPIIRIGNSKGIILHRTILERYGFGEKIEIVMENDHLKLKPIPPPREGWDEAFKKMHEVGDDELLFDDILGDDLWEEWEWK
jgi:antitoxin MazE